MPTDVAEAATQIHFLSLLLRTKDNGARDTEEHVGLSSYAFGLETECLLYEERRVDMEKALDSLQQQRSEDGVRVAHPYVLE